MQNKYFLQLTTDFSSINRNNFSAMLSIKNLHLKPVNGILDDYQDPCYAAVTKNCDGTVFFIRYCSIFCQCLFEECNVVECL